MNTVSKQHPALYKLVVSHYLASALSFVAMAIMLLFASSALNGHYFHPKLLAITHTAALGWGTLIIFGACYQLLPVILETELHSHKLGWVSLTLFFTGMVLLVCAFWTFDPGLCMQSGSLLVLTGTVVFGLNAFLTARKVKKPGIYQEFIITSCIWLLATAILGTLMVFNFQYAFLHTDHLQFLKLHAHMGIGGWFLLLIVGVSSKLIPMFLVSTKQKTGYLSACYYLINTALILFLIDTYLKGLNSKTYFIAVLAIAGIFCWMAYVFHCFKSRMRKSFDLPIWHTLLSLGLLLISVVVLPFIIFYQLKADPLSVKNTNLYGTLLFMGWITALILGQTFKTLPVIAWIKHYHHLAGKSTIPLPADLFNTKILQLQLLAFSLFSGSFYLGLIFQLDVLLKTGLLCFLITSILYIINIFIIILHKPKSANHGIV
jgi:hypothetical protein